MVAAFHDRWLNLVLFLAWYADAYYEDVEPAVNSGLGWRCRPDGINVKVCSGDKLFTVPNDLTSTDQTNINTLKLEDAGIQVLYNHSLAPYENVLKVLRLEKVPGFWKIEPGVFQNTIKLENIYIYDAPNLTRIHDGVFNVRLPRLRRLSILKTGLHTLPYLGKLNIGSGIMRLLDFEHNKIKGIESNWIRIRSTRLRLDYNKIISVNAGAFNGSGFDILSLQGNSELKDIDPDAFTGLDDIRTLNLSGTSINKLPTNGLQHLEILSITNTLTLKSVPSIHNLQSLIKAEMTYAYHCCAFKRPDIHDPEADKLYEIKFKKLEDDCWSKLRLRPDVGDTLDGNMTNRCNIIRPSRNITCLPEPNAFNPCEDVMGYQGLRITVWFVVLLSIIGNLAVLIVLIAMRADMTVPKFLMCHLAWADLCMGIYLTLIAGFDMYSLGEYFNHAIDWQEGLGCQVAGFLTVFSTELSIFTLTVITGERWYTITHAIHLNRRLSLKTSTIIMFFGWIYACIMAALPIANISNYAQTSICLPLANRNSMDFLYSTTLLVFGGVAFFIIVVSYGCMYSSVRDSREEATPTARSDMTVAKRMALLVLKEFVCYTPIAFFAIAALAGQSLITVGNIKFLLVFVYPLSSFANPYLYAIFTRQYRRDLYTLLARNGICNNKTTKYKDGIWRPPTTDERASNRSNRRISKRRTTDSHQRTSSTLATTILTSSDPSAQTEKPSNGCETPRIVTNDCQGAPHEFHIIQNGDTGACSHSAG